MRILCNDHNCHVIILKNMSIYNPVECYLSFTSCLKLFSFTLCTPCQCWTRMPISQSMVELEAVLERCRRRRSRRRCVVRGSARLRLRCGIRGTSVSGSCSFTSCRCTGTWWPFPLLDQTLVVLLLSFGFQSSNFGQPSSLAESFFSPPSTCSCLLSFGFQSSNFGQPSSLPESFFSPPSGCS